MIAVQTRAHEGLTLRHRITWRTYNYVHVSTDLEGVEGMPSLVVVARHEIKNVQRRLEVDEGIPKIALIFLPHEKMKKS